MTQEQTQYGDKAYRQPPWERCCNCGVKDRLEELRQVQVGTPPETKYMHRAERAERCAQWRLVVSKLTPELLAKVRR